MTAKEAETLEPCPFCGDGVGYYTGLRAVQRKSELYRGLTDFWIECPGCGASGPARRADHTQERSAKLAAERWNCRAPAASPEGLGVPQEDPDPSPKPSGDGLVDREVIARVIDPAAWWPENDTPKWKSANERAQHVALTKADSIITLLGGRSGNTSSVAGSSRGFMAPTDGLHSAGKED